MTEDSEKGVPPDSVDKLRKMLAYLDDMDDRQELRAPTARRPQRHVEPQRYA
jgi:hypothetical protein